MAFRNRLIEWIIDEAGGVVGATPKGMGHHILSSMKTIRDARITMF